MKKMLMAVLVLGLVVGGSGCSIVEGFLVAINLNGLSGTYAINPGPVTSYGGSKNILASDYLNPDFSDEIKEVRIYDITIQTGGTYAGNETGGNVTAFDGVNTRTLLTYSGSWAAFSTPQSLLQALQGNSTLIQAQPGAINFLVDAILNKRDIQLSATGNLSSSPVPDGLSLTCTVLGQVMAQP